MALSRRFFLKAAAAGSAALAAGAVPASNEPTCTTIRHPKMARYIGFAWREVEWATNPEDYGRRMGVGMTINNPDGSIHYRNAVLIAADGSPRAEYIKRAEPLLWDAYQRYAG